MNATDPRPISSPPVDEPVRNLTEQQRQILEDVEAGRQAYEEDAHYEAVAAVPPHRVVMVYANRFNYSHYYRLPAHVGIQNVPSMIQEMMREGCKLTDIQITFEVAE